MDSNGEDGHGKNREIKYQVGWKKGRIILSGASRQEMQGEREDATLPDAGRIGNVFRSLLGEAPDVSGQLLYIYALLLPAAVFALTLILLYLLLN